MVRKLLRCVCFCLLVLVLAVPAMAQNTKGDRPAPEQRETRFKTPRKANKKSRPAQRVRRGDDKPSRRAGAPPSRQGRRSERAGKPIRPTFSKSKPQDTQRAWKGDISGRRIRPRSSSSRAWNVYPQPDNINYSSRNLRRTLRHNENPNVKRVRRMQRADDNRPRVGKPIRPTFHRSRPREQQRAWRGDITGRPIRARRSDNIWRPGSDGGVQLGDGQRRPGRNSGISPFRSAGRALNIFSRRSFYVNNQSRRPGFGGGTFSPKGTYPRQARRNGDGKIIPRSASAPFFRNRSINAWAQFAKPRRKRLAADRDLAGHRLRGKSYETPRPVLTNPTWNYQRRIAGGDRPYKGPGMGGHVSRSRSGRAWLGDIAHRALRAGKSPRGGDRAFLGFLKGGGYDTRSGERRGGLLRGRTPRIGAKGIANYRGRMRANRRGFGDQGESYSGNIRVGKRGFGNQGETYTGNIRRGRRGFADQGEEFSGNIRRGRRGFGDQGEEYSGNIRRGRRGFGDQGETFTGNIRRGRRGFSDQGEEHSGNIKRGRRGFGDQGETFTGNIRRGRRGFSDQGEEYSGNIRRGRRGFGDQGEEYSGNIRRGGRAFNYQGEEYTGNIPLKQRRGFSDQGEEYTGNIKARRPDKGGGSRSGKLWNNNNTPILVRVPKGRSARIAGYQGNIRADRTRPYRDQGEEYSGNIKAQKPRKGGGSVSGILWNNNGKPIPSRTYSGQSRMTGYAGNIKSRRPEKGGGSVSGILWNNNETPIAVRKPKVREGDNYQGDFKRSWNHYTKNRNAHDDALKSVKASAATLRAGRSVTGVRRTWDYVKNPSSADEAQRTREPGRAFARLADYQGNLKVKRFDLFGKSDLHPDARFVRTNRNNVPQEKDPLTNLKLWWARLFRKSETQPDHLKEKPGKPRYDKGEAGMWYE